MLMMDVYEYKKNLMKPESHRDRDAKGNIVTSWQWIRGKIEARLIEYKNVRALPISLKLYHLHVRYRWSYKV